MFICNHCPFVKHVNHELVNLANDYKNRKIGFTAISANDVVNVPDDAPELMKQVAMHLHYPFSYLYDETQQVARAYDAACTPDFLFMIKTCSLYTADNWMIQDPAMKSVNGKDIRHALDCLISDQPVLKSRSQYRCNIKWRQ